MQSGPRSALANGFGLRLVLRNCGTNRYSVRKYGLLAEDKQIITRLILGSDLLYVGFYIIGVLLCDFSLKRYYKLSLNPTPL